MLLCIAVLLPVFMTMRYRRKKHAHLPSSHPCHTLTISTTVNVLYFAAVTLAITHQKQSQHCNVIYTFYTVSRQQTDNAAKWQ